MASRRFGPNPSSQQNRRHRGRGFGNRQGMNEDRQVNVSKHLLPTDASDKTNNDCEIVVADPEARVYAELIEDNLKRNGLRVDLFFPSPYISVGTVVKDFASRGAAYAVLVNQTNALRSSATVYFLAGRTEEYITPSAEHINMPLDVALNLIIKDFDANKAKSQEQEVSRTITKAESQEEDVSRTVTKAKSQEQDVSRTVTKAKSQEQDVSRTITKTKSQEQDVSRTVSKAKSQEQDVSRTVTRRDSPVDNEAAFTRIFETLRDRKDVTLAEYDRVIKYLKIKRDFLAIRISEPTHYVGSESSKIPESSLSQNNSLKLHEQEVVRKDESAPSGLVQEKSSPLHQHASPPLRGVSILGPEPIAAEDAVMYARQLERRLALPISAFMDDNDGRKPRLEETRSPSNTNVKKRGSAMRNRNSAVQNQSSTGQNQDSNIQTRGSTAQNQDSSMQNRSSTVQKPSPTVQKQTSNIQNRSSTVQKQSPTVQKQTSNIQKRGSTVRNKGFSMQKRGSAVQNQDSSIQNRGSTEQSQGSNMQNRGSTVQNQGSIVQNRGSTVQNQRPDMQNRSSVQNKGSVNLQNRGSTTQNLEPTLRNQSSTIQKRGSAMRNQGSNRGSARKRSSSTQNRGSAKRNRGSVMRNQGFNSQYLGSVWGEVFSMQNQGSAIRNQISNVQNMGWDMRNQGYTMHNQNSAMQNRTSIIQNESFPMDNLDFLIPNRGSILQNKDFAVNNLGFIMQDEDVMRYPGSSIRNRGFTKGRHQQMNRRNQNR